MVLKTHENLNLGQMRKCNLKILYLIFASGQSCPPLCDPMDCRATRVLGPWAFSGKDAGVGSPFLLQRIRLTQGLNARLPSLLQRQGDSSPLSYLASPLLVLNILFLCQLPLVIQKF